MKIITNFNFFPEKGSVLAFGNFDGLHIGHERIINEVKSLAKEQNSQSAILTFDPHPKKFFNNNIDGFYLTNLKQKISTIESMGIDLLHVIDFTQSFAELSAENFIQDILIAKCNVNALVIGNNCSFGHKKAGDINLLKKLSKLYKYKVTQLNEIKIEGLTCSSSKIRDLLQTGDVKAANRILGRDYAIQGIIEQGLQRGRKIGFPTININLDDYMKPKYGVYLVKITIENKYYHGIANLGIRPTFIDNQRALLEVHIFNFSDDVYGKNVSVEMLDFIRPEKKFSNTEGLGNQIKLDIIVAKRYLR